MQSTPYSLKPAKQPHSPLSQQLANSLSGFQLQQPPMRFPSSINPSALDKTHVDQALLNPPNVGSTNLLNTSSNTRLIAPLSTSLIHRPTTQTPFVPRAGQVTTITDESPITIWDDVDEVANELKSGLQKADAQKKKHIPPFVLKLWSFLNEDRNSDLIRWTEEGTAFTVLDEDEFARTLIPELFKHNNYASFVRQLNMYGFHKKVGLNANSMKAAEKKTKDPNVYSHEFFRQGREDLLPLIQKPITKSTLSKRKRGTEHKDADSDDDKQHVVDGEDTSLTHTRQASSSDMVLMPKGEVVAMRQEVQRLQRQQGIISKMIGQLKDQNEQFYRQASEFQSLHERHENSINAILTFLATFYNRSLEAGMDLSNMFGTIPNLPQQNQGNVVDVGDGEPHDTSQLHKFRKPQLLLQSSPAQAQGTNNSAIADENHHFISPSSKAQRRDKRDSVDDITELPSDKSSPLIRDVTDQYADNEDMMSLINAANASTPPGSTTPQLDFSNALNHAQNAKGNTPLTTQQRTNMLSLIANQQNGGQLSGSTNNALISPIPPPMPDMSQFARNQEHLETLARLQKEQDSKVQDLAGRLQPLSPNGPIPGLNDSYLAEPSPIDFDIDAFLRDPYALSTDIGADNSNGVMNGIPNDKDDLLASALSSNTAASNVPLSNADPFDFSVASESNNINSIDDDDLFGDFGKT